MLQPLSDLILIHLHKCSESLQVDKEGCGSVVIVTARVIDDTLNILNHFRNIAKFIVLFILRFLNSILTILNTSNNKGSLAP